ncbi:MAG: hypothetical protein C0619_04450 [Desulfuromonas sp.]|nr:MAG: hypothetical protein C0619_04450 [Desulfuromonas sp.]
MARYVLLLVAVMMVFASPFLVHADAHDPQRIVVAEVMEKMNSGVDILFLDTRNSRDWTEAKEMIPAAIRIDSNETLTRVANETPKDKLIVTYCT